MIDRFREGVRRFRSRLPDSFVVLSCVFGVLAAVMMAVGCYWTGALWQPGGDRQTGLAGAELMVEAASLVAVAFAIIEVRRSLRRPNLRLWMQQLTGGKPQGEPADLGTVCHVSQEEHGVSIVYVFIFKLLLANSGEAVARYVKVSVGAHDPRPSVGPPGPHNRTSLHLIGVRGHEMPEWTSDRYDPSLHTFRGGDSFVAYSNPGRARPQLAECEDLGELRLYVPVPPGGEQGALPELRCTIQADGFALRSQTLSFRIPPPNDRPAK